jgi:hypothetical protein
MYTLTDLHSLVDFGMCVVLWLVQLIIYPSFLRIEPSQLTAWHQAYTFRVSFIIVPLLFAQLGLATFAAITQRAALDLIVLALVLLCWTLTFFVSVPLHNKLAQGDLSETTRRRLIRTNWPRTILWTSIFVIGLYSRGA